MRTHTAFFITDSHGRYFGGTNELGDRWLPKPNSAIQYPTYEAATKAIDTLNLSGFYQIQKVWIKVSHYK